MAKVSGSGSVSKSVEALKATLLAAKSVAYSASASGVYLSTELFPKLGVAERLQTTGKKILSERVGAVVARGDAELGFQQVSELIYFKELDFVGTLPEEVQQTIFFSAGIVADSNPEHEYEETCNKARAMMKAIELAERGLE